MTEATERRSLDHVVLPRRLPGLALLERYFPSPADNLLDAELTAFASPGDTVLDPWAGTGWTAHRSTSTTWRSWASTWMRQPWASCPRRIPWTGRTTCRRPRLA